MRWLLFVVAFAVGGFVTLQTASNTRLKETLGEPLVALILSSSIGVAALAGYGKTAPEVTRRRFCVDQGTRAGRGIALSFAREPLASQITPWST